MQENIASFCLYFLMFILKIFLQGFSERGFNESRTFGVLKKLFH